jgi:hypothetical protein
MAKHTSRHFVCIDPTNNRVWLRSSTTQTYRSATFSKEKWNLGDPCWHRDGRGVWVAIEVNNATAADLRDAIKARQEGLRMAGHKHVYSNPSSSWVLAGELTKSLSDHLMVRMEEVVEGKAEQFLT